MNTQPHDSCSNVENIEKEWEAEAQKGHLGQTQNRLRNLTFPSILDVRKPFPMHKCSWMNALRGFVYKRH